MSIVGLDMIHKLLFGRRVDCALIHASGESCIEELLFIVENKHISQGELIYALHAHDEKQDIFFV